MNTIDHQKKPADADDARPVNTEDHTDLPGTQAPDHQTHNVFRATAVVIGGLMGGAAILINWTVGKLFS